MDRFLGRFHLVLLHFPIGFIALACVLELYALRRPAGEVRRILSLVLVLASLSAAAVAALGWMLAAGGGYEAATLRNHRWLGVSSVLLFVLATAAHWRAFGPRPPRRARATYRLLLLASATVLAATSHLGGTLTHGRGYLLRYAPDFLKELVAAEEPDRGRGLDPESEDPTFREKIRPILEARCWSCHGPQKQKGDYRLDLREAAFAGGDSGEPAVVPGDPGGSGLARRITLPRDHEDAMPPRGKEPLTAEEILEILRWIHQGAPWAAEAPASSRGPEGRPVAPPPSSASAGGGGAVVDFARDVRPILEHYCIRCHGPRKRKGRLRLHTLEMVLAGGKDDGPAVVPGKPEESPLYRRPAIRPADDKDDERMPPEDEGGPLRPEELDIIRRWIAQGAVWPEGLVLEEQPEPAGG